MAKKMYRETTQATVDQQGNVHSSTTFSETKTSSPSFNPKALILAFFCVMIFFYLIGWVDTRFIKSYPGYPQLLYFDVFAYLRSWVDYRNELGNVFEGWIIGFPHANFDGNWVENVLAALALIVNILLAVVNFVFFLIKFGLTMPMSFIIQLFGLSLPVEFTSFLMEMNVVYIPYIG